MTSSKMPGARSRSIKTSRSAEGVDRNRIPEAAYRNLPLGVESQSGVVTNGVSHRLRDNDGRRLRLTAETGGQIDRASDRGIIEVLRRPDISDHGAARVDTDAE